MILGLEVLNNIIELGLIYSLVVLGVYFSSQVIKFDDLSVEGSFSIGGALTAMLLVFGFHATLTLPLAIIAGCIVGLVTGLLHTKLGMNGLISGIVVTAGLFSIALKIAGPNVALMQQQTLFEFCSQVVNPVVLLVLIVGTAFIAIWLLLGTEVGFLFKSVGVNPQMLTNLGKRINVYKIAGVMIANALSAAAGSLFVHHMKFYSITGCIGTLIVALAGLIIGQSCIGNSLPALLAGSLLYQAVISLTIEMQLDPMWNKLIASFLIIALVFVRNNRKKIVIWR